MRRDLNPLNLLRRQKGRLQRYLHRRGTHLSRTNIIEALKALGRIEAPVLMVHSSLSACGQIEGGAQTVVESLIEWAGPATLAMPTHTYSYPKGRLPAPVFDPASTPSVVGAITNYFWNEPDVVRSIHPSHSLACAGPMAGEICENHEWADTPCGAGTPYEKLLQLDCAVLMFGVALDAYTFFHTAEDAAAVPYLYLPRKCELAIRDAGDVRWTWPVFRQDMGIPRRFAEMDNWLEKRKLLRRGKLGLGELLFVPRAGAAHRQLVEALRRDPWLLVNRPPTLIRRSLSSVLSRVWFFQ